MENDIERAAKLLLQSKYVTGLSGAGISVESGIRPFRGSGWDMDGARGAAHGWLPAVYERP